MKNKLKTSSLIGLIVALSCILTLSANCEIYKSIVPIKKIKEIKNIGANTALDLMINQDEDMEEYAKNHSEDNIDDTFKIFYQNLDMLARFSPEELKTKFDEDMNEVLFVDTGLVEFNSNCWAYAELNHEYLEKKYSKYLSKPWQDYLKTSALDNLYTEFTYDGESITNTIILWQDFLKKYPNFLFRKEIKMRLKALTAALIASEYTPQDETDELKNRFEYFLKKVDPNTKEYKIVEKCYKELKKNNYKFSIKYYRMLYNYLNYYIYKNFLNSKIELERIKKLSKHKILKRIYIKRFEKLKNEKINTFNELKNAYHEAKGYCSYINNNLVSENDCTIEYLKLKNARLKKEYKTLYNYCSALNTDLENMSVIYSCIKENME